MGNTLKKGKLLCDQYIRKIIICPNNKILIRNLLFYYRIYSFMVCSSLKKLGILMYLRTKSRYGVDISPWAQLGKGCRLMHAVNIVIGPNASVGDYCKIFNSVTLGNARPDLITLETPREMPRIGKYCVLGAGAKFLGDVIIGDKILIGASVVIRTSVHSGNSEFHSLIKNKKITQV